MPLLFLVAYTCSGLAGLIYQVSWTRLLTLYIGHTTAAISAVVAAFLGGLAIGAAAGGRWASRVTPRRALLIYGALELFVALVAFVLPFEIGLLTPLLRAVYRDGQPGLMFPAVRLMTCLILVFIPAAALGATFPMAIRWFTARAQDAAKGSGVLYALNTTGAAVGALLAGFTLIPSIGVSGTTRVGMAASIVAALCAWLTLKTAREDLAPASGRTSGSSVASGLSQTSASRKAKRQERENKRRAGAEVRRKPDPTYSTHARGTTYVAAAVLGMTGFASLMHEIAWTRLLALTLGPTIYAFAAALAAVIAGVAIGSAIGTSVAARTRMPAAWLLAATLGAALTASVTGVLAGSTVPRVIASTMATSPDVFDRMFQHGMLITAALVLPTAACLGAAFPLALAWTSPAGATASDVPAQAGVIYAVNTIGAVAGSLLSGFVFIPGWGLRVTLVTVSVALAAAAVLVALRGGLSPRTRLTAVATAVATIAIFAFGPPWNLNLLASGAYLYAPYLPKDLDLEVQLTAGTLLYYRDGAPATVSVKRLTGTTTLAVDGKVDASNRSDMLTQKLIAHLPLLLHEQPREVGIIGLGSGVTVGAALTHPVARVDVAEISPEVVEASALFKTENRDALADPRTHLIVADGRSHLLLGSRTYDVLISEPSNPWIAGVAALFTREFFETAKARLARGGIICQWAHTYNIADRDLRSIVGTFLSVFPNGTAWLVGEDDVMLVASNEPLDGRFDNIARRMKESGVSEDLARVAVVDPFSILSLFAAGPDALKQYAGDAPLLEDDTMTLEFSGPRQIHRAGTSGDNGAALTRLRVDHPLPAPIQLARDHAGAAEWRLRAAMMSKTDAHGVAYDDYTRALTLDPTDEGTFDRFVATAILAGRVDDALSWVKGVTQGRSASPAAMIAISKLLARRGLASEALSTIIEARALSPTPGVLQQLAELHADAGNLDALDAVAADLTRLAPGQAPTFFYSAVAAFLRGRVPEAIALGRQAAAADASYAPVYDLLGAALTKNAQPDEARDAFLASLRLNPHDSAAYTNLGLIELTVGRTDLARVYFGEALALEPQSRVARDGLAQASQK